MQIAPRPARLFSPFVLTFLVANLILGALAPSGYMIAPSQSGWPAITVCPETHSFVRNLNAAEQRRHAAMGHDTHTPDHGDTHDGHDISGAVDNDCAFTGMAQLATGAIDPDMLGEAIAFVMQRAVRWIAPLPLSLPQYLRPPLRGPPANS